MKRSEIRSFVEALLERRGARIREHGPALLEVQPDAGKTHVPAPTQLLAFGAKVHRQHPEAELVSVGSAYLDRLVGEATRAGRYTVVYGAVPENGAPAPRPAGLPEPVEGRWGRPHRGYRPVFLFVYVAEFRTIDVPDDLVMIALDPARGETLASPNPVLKRIKRGATDPAEGWEPAGSLPSPGAVLRSLAALDKRLQRRARTFKEAATLEIARETANIEAYYRRLIDEVRHPVGRGRLSTEEECKRVRALQLDWKRRVQEVARFWEAGVFVRLSALGVVMEPCWVFPLRGTSRRGRSRGAGRPFMAADCATGALWRPRCPICGARIRERVGTVGSDLVCAKHVRGG